MGFSSCGHIHPALTISHSESPRRALGTPINVDASWQAWCVDVGATFIAAFQKNSHPDEKRSCFEQSFAVKLSCDTECDFPDGDAATGVGATSLRVIPKTIGATKVAAVSTRLDTQEVFRAEREFEIVLPDDVVIVPERCFGPECLSKPVRAESPVLLFEVVLEERGGDGSPVRNVFPSAALRVNGRPVPIAYDGSQHISLIELFPARTQGTGVAPGVYELTATVGSFERHFTIRAE